jgi:putative ABC transport system permease protein
MTHLHRLVSVVRWLLHRKQAEQDLDSELQDFIDRSAADKLRPGIPPAEARRLATLELGGIEQAKERVRTFRYGASLDEAGRDVSYALRMFARNPGFVVVVVLTLALGIGANTAIFSLIDALMLRWLPVPNPQELVQVELQQPDEKGVRPGGAVGGESFSYAIVRALAARHDIFAGAAGFSGYGFNAGSGDSMRKVPGALVTGAYYETLGLTPAMGRLLTRADDEPGAPLVAVIGDGYWERQFLRDPAAVGRAILLNGVPVTIVGVSPHGFAGANVGSVADITMAVAALPVISPEGAGLTGPGNFWLRVLARPALGLSAAEATARLAVFWSQTADSVIAPHWPAFQRQAAANARFHLSPGGTGWTALRQVYGKPLLVLMGVVMLVLLIACANVASLLLARASARQKEIAVRLAIGAGRGRIMRQLLTESMMLSLIGAAFGILLAWASSRLLVDVISTGPFQIRLDLTPDWHILGFTSAVAMATGLLFGVVPAIHTIAAGPSPALKEDFRMSGSQSRWLSALISAQVALSLLLLVGAGLFVQTLRNLQDFDPGFNREGVLIAELQGRRTAAPKELVDVAQRLPGVVSATLSTHSPLSGAVWTDVAVPQGQPVPERDNAYFIGAGPRFFETLQTPLVSGREFTGRDSADAPGVAIVNEAFARRHFPNQTPVGQYLSATVRGDRRVLEVVGLAKDTRAAGLRRPSPATVYVAYLQLAGNIPTTLEVRASGSLIQVASALRRAVQPRLTDSPVEVLPLSAQVEAAMVQERMMATLAGTFGVLALLLACVGLYGLLAYSVVRRTKEMGIRIALGAPRTHVLAMVLAAAVRLVLIGVVVGLPAAWAASRWVQSMLFGLRPADPPTMAGAIVLLTSAALVAAYLPAYRASRVDAMAALRHD